MAMVTVKPTIKGTKQDYSYNNVPDGDFFIWNQSLWMKSDWGEQDAICIRSGSSSYKHGDTDENFCAKSFIPVDVEINWKPKAGKPEKKASKKKTKKTKKKG